MSSLGVTIARTLSLGPLPSNLSFYNTHWGTFYEDMLPSLNILGFTDRMPISSLVLHSIKFGNFMLGKS
jgi:hypothetical protein